MSDVARVARLPKCDFCRHPSEGGRQVPAEYDFKTSYGPWAHGCERHWITHRMYSDLGTGKGQRLVVLRSV